MKLFIFGLGYTGGFVAADQKSRGASVFATVQSPERAQQLSSDGLTVRVFSNDETDPRIAEDIQESDALLLSVPPGEFGDPVLKHWSSAIASAPGLRWIGYLSTVGVYGDHQGGWVNEATPVAPSSARSRRRADAEREWLGHWQRAKHHKAQPGLQSHSCRRYRADCRGVDGAASQWCHLQCGR
jgi:nucleoside-diphosphate-sugar epimerase